MDAYTTYLYSDAISRKFQVGDKVFVWLKSNRSTGAATILRTPDSLPFDSPFPGRYLVQYDVDSSLTAHVRPERLYPVYEEQQLILVCYSTEDYRRLARSQVTRADTVLELGCSYGMCTNMLAEHAMHVIGIDNSEELVAEARRRYPHVQFEVADVLEQPATVLNIISGSTGSHSCKACSSNSTAAAVGQAAAADANVPTAATPTSASDSRPSCNVVFADIGGDRQLEALLRLIPWILQHLKPRLLVVKSEELAVAAGKQLLVQQQQQLQEAQQQQQLQESKQQQQLLVQQQQQLQQPKQQQLQEAQQQQLQDAQHLGVVCHNRVPTVAADKQQQQQLQEAQQGLVMMCRIQEPTVAANKQQQQQQQQQQCQHQQGPDTTQQLGSLAIGAGNQQHQQLQQDILQDPLQEQHQFIVQQKQQQQQQQQNILQDSLQEQHQSINLQQQQEHLPGSQRQQSQQAAVAAANAEQRQHCPPNSKASNTTKCPTYGQTQNPKAWWDQLEIQQGLNPLLHAGCAETWFLNAKAQGFVKNPLRYPQRFNQQGVRICRPYNYDRCYKIEICEFDHVHCHHCGTAGHRAVDCPVT